MHNGFPVAVHLDALFDGGLMTSDTDGAARLLGGWRRRSRLVLGQACGSLRLRRVDKGGKVTYHHSVGGDDAYPRLQRGGSGLEESKACCFPIEARANHAART